MLFTQNNFTVFEAKNCEEAIKLMQINIQHSKSMQNI